MLVCRVQRYLCVNFSKPSWIQLQFQSNWIQAGFDKFKHTYLCTPRTHKGFKGTVVNRALLSLHGRSIEGVISFPFKRKNSTSSRVFYQNFMHPVLSAFSISSIVSVKYTCVMAKQGLQKILKIPYSMICFYLDWCQVQVPERKIN